MIRILATLIFLLSVFSTPAFATVNSDVAAGEDCLRMVNLQYHSVVTDLKGKNDHAAVEVVDTHGRSIDLQQCNEIAARQQAAFIAEAKNRVEAAIRFYRNKSPLNEQEQAIIEQDFHSLRRLPASASKNQYLRLYKEYRGYSSSKSNLGVVKLKSDKKVYRCVDSRGETTYSKKPCSTMTKKIRQEFKPASNTESVSSAAKCKSFDDWINRARQDYAQEVKKLAAAGSKGENYNWQQLQYERSQRLTDLFQVRRDTVKAGCSISPPIDTAPSADMVSNAQLRKATAAEPQVNDSSPPSGRFLPAGELYAKRTGASFSLLPDGSMLQFGSGQLYFGKNPHSEYIDIIREKRGHLAQIGGARYKPMLWDPEKNSWIKLELPPECESKGRLLHTATVLNENQVLIAGGLCVKPALRNEPRVEKEFTHLSIWDARSRSWLAGPRLARSRIFHTASLLQDGSVLIVGGQVDPAIDSTKGPTLVQQVERYKDQQVTRVNPMITARAMHTSTVTRNGCLLVAGGYGQEDRALSKVEQWCPQNGRWQALPGLATARFGHSATLLEDGRILIIGGKDRAGNLLASTEIWNPGLASWQQGPRLPTPLFKNAVTRLNNGTVLIAGGALNAKKGIPVPWAWTWDTHSRNWNIAGQFMANNDHDLNEDVSLIARPDGGALFFTADLAMHWKPITDPVTNKAPVWDNSPVATILQDGRAMYVGREMAASTSGQTNAHIWDPRDKTWQSAGTLNRKYYSRSDIFLAESGDVYFVGTKSRNNLHCETWSPQTTQWRTCGSIQAKYKLAHRIELGQLADGRLFVLPNTSEAIVLDSNANLWDYWTVEWHASDLGYGSPVFPKSNLAEIKDPVSGQKFAINDTASRIMKRAGNNPATSLLWNPRKKYWSFILPKKSMGSDAQFLPDGCAISLNRNGVFNPDSGRITPMQDPGYGIKFDKEFVIFADGSIIVAGVPEGAADPGSGIFHGKASCDGVKPIDEDNVYFTAALENWKKKAIDSGKKTIAQIETELNQEKAELQKQQAMTPMDKALKFTYKHRHWLFLVLALAIVLKLLAFIEVSFAPPPPTWLMKFSIFGLLIVYLAPTLISHVYPDRARLFTTHGYSKRACENDISRCINPESGLLWPVADDASEIPCYMVGLWSFKAIRATYRIKLLEDGTYIMTGDSNYRSKRGGHTGYWSVQGENMVWRHKGGSEMDINRLIPESDNRFQVIEMNGKTRTLYQLIEPGEPKNCVS